MADISQFSFEQQAKTLQIIRGALIFGVAFFAVLVVGFLAGMPSKLEFGMFEIILVVFVVQAFVVYFFAPKFIKLDQSKRDEIKKLPNSEKDKALMPIVTSTEIVRGAMIEGATFFALILVLIADSQVGLIVGLLLIGVAFAVFPTMSRIRSAVETRKYEQGL